VTTFATDPAETRVINRRDVGEQTVLMRTDLATVPISPIRFETDQHAAIPYPETIADVTPFQPPVGPQPRPGPPPTPPPGPPVPPPAWAAPAAVYPLVFPAPLERVAGPDETEVVSLLDALGGVEAPRVRRSQPYRKPQGWVRTRRHRAPMPVPALLACCYGAGLAGGMTILSIAWQVAR
jgi:hypothetical protein